TSMDETTQQNAALVEEAAAAAESLVDQANQLAGAISQFKLDGRGGSGVASSKANAGRKAYNAGQKPLVAHLPKPVAPNHSPHVSNSNPAPKIPARTGTDDGDWEEF
ncbi:chemotaxis protein, partial [Methylophilus sp. 'Pure River']